MNVDEMQLSFFIEYYNIYSKLYHETISVNLSLRDIVKFCQSEDFK